jgi:hypothetical protein
MPPSYDEAVASLHRGGFDEFVAERKRLAAELKAAGDKEGAARLTKHTRPTISAWAVNQLWWREREAMERLFSAARRLREGDNEQSREHRQALALLRERARTLLADSGHASVESTLRRVTTTLSALAVNGGFEPDAPGALANDRDPPGFEAGFAPSASAPPVAASPAVKEEPAVQRERLEAERERLRQEEEAARRRSERQRVQAELREVQQELEAAELEIEAKRLHLTKLQSDIAALEEGIERVRAREQQLTTRLAEDTALP